MKVLLHPGKSREVVESSNHVASIVEEFHRRVGVDGNRQALEARRWTDAATEARDRALETGNERVEAAKRLGMESLDRARSATGKVSGRIAAERGRRGDRRSGQD
jgi:hypothetical protein